MEQRGSRRRQALLLLVLAAALGLAAPRGAVAWSWTLPVGIYQNLDFSERAGIDRARAAFQRAEDARQRRMAQSELIPLYRGASAEWKKFQLQHGLSASDQISSYVLFMQGYALQGAGDRNAAVAAYTELLDYYPDQRWIATAALYHIGQAHLDTGDDRLARSTFLSLVEDKEHAVHPLAARAYQQLASLYWREKRPGEALECWKQGLGENYKQIARDEYNAMRDSCSQALAVLSRWDEYERLLFEDIPPEDAKRRAAAVQGAVGTLQNRFLYHWGGWYYDTNFDEKERNVKRLEWRGSLATWYDSHRGLFEADGRQWDHALLSLRLWQEFQPETAAKRVPKVRALLTALEIDDAARAKCARDFAIQLCDAKMFDEARTLPEIVKETVANRWMVYEIESRAGELPAAQLALEELVANADPAVSLQAKKTLAWFHKERTRDYEKAIALYIDIAQPPGTLWDLQECYRRAGKKNEAYTILTELASIFPSEAPRAVWTHGQYREQDGEKEKAIALYRRLLTQPDWKKSGESSLAHQALERLGIATGGAVVSEVR